MTPNTTKMGEVIARIRSLRNLKRPDVAHAVGVTSNYLGMVEAGRRTLAAVTLNKLAEALDVPPEFITCLGSLPPPAGDPRSRFSKLLVETQKAMMAAIDTDQQQRKSK